MTSFKSWLKNVHMEQLNEQGYSPSEMLPPVMLCRMLRDGETTIDDLEAVIEKAGRIFEEDFRDLWDSYQCYIGAGDGEKRFAGDTAIRKV